MARNIECDRCGNGERQNMASKWAKLQLYEPMDNPAYAVKELCPQCTKEVKDFINTPPVRAQRRHMAGFGPSE